MIVTLLILIVSILLFGAAAVKGWIGSVAVAILTGAAMVLIFTALWLVVGRENFDILVAAIIGGLIVVGVWAKKVERSPIQVQRSTDRSISEVREARIREEHAAMFRNPTLLTKEEKKRRKKESRGDFT